MLLTLFTTPAICSSVSLSVRMAFSPGTMAAASVFKNGTRIRMMLSLYRSAIWVFPETLSPASIYRVFM